VSRRRVLIVGGYGTFGARAAERLAIDSRNDIVVAGRELGKAQRTVEDLAAKYPARITATTLDANAPDVAALRTLAPQVIINASGPFQTQAYHLAEAAIAVGAHYVDLADGRAFVSGISKLDAAARKAGVLVVSGASTVPGLSSAVIDEYLPQFGKLRRLRYGIVPANSFDPGVATTRSILGYVGRPVSTLRNRKSRQVFGWQNLTRHDFPGMGRRWLGACDIPDLDLFPARYPDLETIDFGAGLDVGFMHLGLWGMSWLVRGGLVRDPVRLAQPLLALKRRLHFFGSDTGGMFVELAGTGRDGNAKRIIWHMIAFNNHGPYVPQVPATSITNKLLDGRTAMTGATPCLGLMSLANFKQSTADLDVTTSVEIDGVLVN
jgi:saccharopine dehydrogenase-like NADP-dependent oxidoreductase